MSVSYGKFKPQPESESEPKEEISFFSAKEHKMIELEVLGRPTKEIAEAVGVCRETISRWRAIPEIRDEIAAQRSALYKSSLASRFALQNETIEELRTLIHHNNPNIRLKAIALARQLVDMDNEIVLIKYLA